MENGNEDRKEQPELQQAETLRKTRRCSLSRSMRKRGGRPEEPTIATACGKTQRKTCREQPENTERKQKDKRKGGATAGTAGEVATSRTESNPRTSDTKAGGGETTSTGEKQRQIGKRKGCRRRGTELEEDWKSPPRERGRCRTIEPETSERTEKKQNRRNPRRL